MSGYDSYLEELIDLKDKEIQLYKNFIERTLRCKIKEELRPIPDPDCGFRVDHLYKIITIPESQIAIMAKFDID